MRYKFLIVSLVGISIVGGSCKNETRQKNQSPNIIYILADDLGYGDLSCYGQKHFHTPNIDQMASEGMLFTQHYAGCSVCAPSRSSLMTGQTTGHTPIRGNKGVEPEGQWPLPAKSFTIAEMLKSAGYTTGAFGKWGLGFIGTEGDPNKQGFDTFYGYNCQTLAHNYYPDHLWYNDNKITLDENQYDRFGQYAPDLIHAQALKFIEGNKDKPFFMYYPTTIPHAELLLPEENLVAFRGKYLPEKVFEGATFGDERFRSGAYGFQPESHAAFAAMVTLLDKQVGELMAKLKELGLDKNTLVVFSSDNGPHQEGGADPDYFVSNGILKGYKRDLYEGGIREPMIVWWPGKIKARSTSDHVSAFWDVMPTFTDLLGMKAPQNIDGISFLPSLLGREGQKQHDYLFWEFHEKGGRQAVRKDNWKLVRYNVLDPEKITTELYNLNSDPGEENNVADHNPVIVQELLLLMSEARTPSDVFTFRSETIIR